jgi:hypothetical protein
MIEEARETIEEARGEGGGGLMNWDVPPMVTTFWTRSAGFRDYRSPPI